MRALRHVLPVLLSCAACAACDKEPSKLDAILEASTAPAVTAMGTTTATAQAPSPPQAPQIVIDDGACAINGEEILFASPDAAGRIAAALAGKPLVEGQILSFEAAREAKTPKIAIAVSAFRRVKAKGAVVHTRMRDTSIGELPLLLQHGPLADCSATGMVARDGAVSVWPLGGGTAQRFVRGLAGPDLTLGSAAVRRLSVACDSPTWLLAAADNIPWGLTFDLALAVRGGSDAGSGVRASQTLLVSPAPVAGRKVVTGD